MVQYLRLPIDDCKFTAGYKNTKYKQQFNFTHYGNDIVSRTRNRALHALGNGRVIAAGLDGVTTKDAQGYVCVIEYKDCYNHKLKRPMDVVVTYFHMESAPKVKKGQIVTKDTLLGYYGATGRYVKGAHLHIQADTDTKYPLYCQGITKGTHKILKQGVSDSTLDISELLYIDKNQSLVIAKDAYYDLATIDSIPVMPSLTEIKSAI